MKKTQFSIITYFDPYGDMKSARKKLGAANYESDLPLSEIDKIIDTYNNGQYYHAVSISTFIEGLPPRDFDSSFYLTEKARPSTYQSVPGF